MTRRPVCGLGGVAGFRLWPRQILYAYDGRRTRKVSSCCASPPGNRLTDPITARHGRARLRRAQHRAGHRLA
jgi:hypothetical protein